MAVPALCSFLLHAAAAALMLLNTTAPTTLKQPTPTAVDIVQATAVDNKIVEQELQRLQQVETKKKEKEQKHQKDLEKKPLMRRNGISRPKKHAKRKSGK